MNTVKSLKLLLLPIFSLQAYILPHTLSAHTPYNSYQSYQFEQPRLLSHRDYTRSLTAQELKEIRYILKALATKSLTGLLKCRADLERAGEAVESVHPLQFLLAVFIDEEMKVYIHNIKKRGKWVWGEFVKGLKRSLQEEYEKGNLTPEMIEDFANQLQIPVSLIEGLIGGSLWEDFIKTLITAIPREGDPGRYDQ